MAELRCRISNCVYNKDEYCCKGDILVGGKHANESRDTSCESFVDRKGNTYTSAMDHPSRTIQIDCEAAKCIYNHDYKCHADAVEIEGNRSACSSGETVCGTFKVQQAETFCTEIFWKNN